MSGRAALGYSAGVLLMHGRSKLYSQAPPSALSSPLDAAAGALGRSLTSSHLASCSCAPSKSQSTNRQRTNSVMGSLRGGGWVG